MNISRILICLIVILVQSCNIGGQTVRDDGRSDKSLIVEEKNDLQMFVLLKYPYLVEDIGRGDGPYLRALLQLIGHSPEVNQAHIPVIRSLLLASVDIYDFSNRLLAAFN